MLCDVGISNLGIAVAPRPDIVVVAFRLASISARDVSRQIGSSKYIKLEGFSAVDISRVLSGSKQIHIEQ